MGTTPDDVMCEAAAVLNALAAQAEAVLAGVADSLDTWRADAQRTPARVDAARDLCVASGRLRHAATTAATLGAGGAEHARVHRDDAERTTRVWLARHCGVSRRDAAVLCRNATTLERFTTAETALIDGDIAPGRLDALASIIPARMRGVELRDAISLVGDVMGDLVGHRPAYHC